MKANKDIKEILDEAILQWKDFLENKEISVIFIIPMSYAEVRPNNIVINNFISIKKQSSLSLISGSNKDNAINPLILFETKIPCVIYKSVQEHNNNLLSDKEHFKAEWDKKIKDLQEIVNK